MDQHPTIETDKAVRLAHEVAALTGESVKAAALGAPQQTPA